MIDGTDTLVPVDAEELRDKVFRILDDEEYALPDAGVLFEFYPGDIVEVDDTADMDNEYQYDAIRLIEPSPDEDREYLGFMFHATRRYVPINQLTAVRYKAVLERIHQERKAGRFFYRGILETVDALNKF
jgi:hypothetical protein